jgi:hypothetical protein
MTIDLYGYFDGVNTQLEAKYSNLVYEWTFEDNLDKVANSVDLSRKHEINIPENKIFVAEECCFIIETRKIELVEMIEELCRVYPIRDYCDCTVMDIHDTKIDIRVNASYFVVKPSDFSKRSVYWRESGVYDWDDVVRVLENFTHINRSEIIGTQLLYYI